MTEFYGAIGAVIFSVQHNFSVLALRVAVSFATSFMAWIINCALLFAWTLVHLGLKPL
jgi:hypothetical protein